MSLVPVLARPFGKGSKASGMLTKYSPLEQANISDVLVTNEEVCPI